MKLYRKYTGKITWLANSTRPDLCYLAMKMSKKNQGATMADLQDINRVLKKVRVVERRLMYEQIGEKEDLMIVGIGDTSFKTDDKVVGGVFLFLAN